MRPGKVGQVLTKTICVGFVDCGFSLHAKILGGSFDELFPACAFFKKWNQIPGTNSESLGRDQSIVAQRSEMTVDDERSLTSSV